MTPLTPDQTARIAEKVYDLRTFSVAQMSARGLPLGCEGLFKPAERSRFTGKSGFYAASRTSGFGYVAEGEGTRMGELLIATRGTHTAFDLVGTDLHTGLRRGPSGIPVHIGFQRVWESYEQELKELIRGKNPTHIHCVGHSLGGALAMLNADYFSSLSLPVSVYTFGCPRVGLWSFSQDLTRKVGEANIYRVSHDSDPVTMVPAFPFLHAPYRGKHYTVARGGTISLGAHFMTGYLQSAKDHSWSSLANAKVPLDWTDAIARTWLDAVKSGGGGITMYAAASLELIAQALRWLVRKAIGLGFVFPACNSMGAGLTALDLLATLVTRSAELSRELADDVKAIMNAILQFLGRTALTAVEITHLFARWVFDLLYTSIGSMANRALMGDGNRE